MTCYTLLQAAAWLIAISTPFNAFLFLIRVVGIFRGSRIMVYGFTALWTGTFLLLMVTAVGYKYTVSRMEEVRGVAEEIP